MDGTLVEPAAVLGRFVSSRAISRRFELEETQISQEVQPNQRANTRSHLCLAGGSSPRLNRLIRPQR
jgi:hypothetical protein